MNSIIILFIILCILFYINSKESFENDNNYYIDSEGKHNITKLPITLTNITELKYSSKDNNNNLKFVSTKGGYNNISTKNQLSIINGQQSFIQSLHLKNTIPFSGVLF